MFISDVLCIISINTLSKSLPLKRIGVDQKLRKLKLPVSEVPAVEHRMNIVLHKHIHYRTHVPTPGPLNVFPKGWPVAVPTHLIVTCDALS